MTDIKRPDQETIDAQLNIDDSSMYNLEQELKNSAQEEYKYHRDLTEAMEQVSGLELDLDILKSSIIDRYLQENPETPKSAISEIRKMIVPLDKEYQELRRRIITLKGAIGDLEGVIRAFKNRSYRLKEICKLNERRLLYGDNPTIRETKPQMEKSMIKAASKLEY